MSQYCSRINIKVKNTDIWKKFKDKDDAEFNLVSLSETNETSFIIDGDWSCDEDELEGIVKVLAETLEKDGIIIADTTNINVDPYDYCVYYFGEKVNMTWWNSIDEEDDDFGDMFSDTNIENIVEWLNYTDFHLTENEKKNLEEYDIIALRKKGKIKFEQISSNIKIPSEITLRETSITNHAEIIEKISVGTNLTLVRNFDNKFDSKKIEVMYDNCVIGSLPSYVSDELATLMDAKKLKYTAKVLKLVPLSKRNAHAKSPIVIIAIDAKLVK